MLSPGDAALAARDRTLPDLPLVLDPDVLAGEVSTAVGVPLTLTATYVRYKPGTSCLVGCRLAGGGAAVDAYATTRHRDDGKIAKVVGRATTASPWGPGAVRVGAATALVFFPNDRHLRGARTLADPRRGPALLHRLLPEQGDAWTPRLTRLRYKPERRFVARVDGAGAPAAVVKSYAPAHFRAADEGLKAFHSRGPLRIARRLGASSRHHLTAVEWVAGDPLQRLIHGGDCAAEAVEAVGTALAQLHKQEPRGLVRLERETEAVLVLATARTLGWLVPELGGQSRSLAIELANDLLALPDGRHAIHGDFSADQVLLTSDAAAIIDYDAAAVGDPAADLGLFRATLLADAAAGHLTRAGAERLVEALTSGYPVTFDDPRRRLDLYTAAWLLRLAVEPFRYRVADWPERTAALVTLATELVRA
ncbi:MAG: phosphotransferase [Actinomycetota bacterium]|nr:phosphotransferase [Actinomycetota bacterium]